MNILCCIHSLAGGGAEHLMAGLASGLAARHRVALLTLDDDARDAYPVSPAVERIALHQMRHSRTPWQAIRNNVGRIRSVRRAVRAWRPDVVLSFCDQMNVTALWACRPLRVPIVVAEMTDPRFHPLPKIWRKLRPWLYRTATAVVAISCASQPIVSQLHGGPAEFIPPAVDTAPPKLVPSLPPTGRLRLAALGRLSQEKRFDWLIAAFAKIADRHPQWDLEIAGQGALQVALQQQVDRSAVAARIRLCGRLPEIWSFLAGASAFALSSAYEGTPVALLEAMSLGLPAVAVDCDSGINEVVRHGENGWLVANSVDALAEGLDRLLGDTALRERLSGAARETAAEYGWDAFVARYESLLTRVARR